MKIVFEDKRSSRLSRLFCAAYPDEISKQKFIYSDGNGNLISKVIDNKGVALYDELVLVYIDMIPGNNYLYHLYTKLRRFSIKNNYSIIILPLVCAEWYFICGFWNCGIFQDTTDIKLCLNKGYFRDSELYKKYSKEIPNFENFCKKIIEKYGNECVAGCPKSLRDFCDHDCKICDNYSKYNSFFISDCFCYNKKDICKEFELKNKSLHFISQYPCFFKNSFISSAKIVTKDEIWLLHRKLVKEYNEFVDYYSSRDPEGKCYKYIQIIR